MNTTVRPAQFPADAAAVLDIWREYIASPSVSLDYQGYEAEFEAARKLYEDLGFAPADPVSFNPVPGTSFMGLRLR